MESKVISVINYKGGVGKSTITYNLGAVLARTGKRVLLIDFDGQGNLTKFTGIEKENKLHGNIVDMLNEVMKGGNDFIDPIYHV